MMQQAEQVTGKAGMVADVAIAAVVGAGAAWWELFDRYGHVLLLALFIIYAGMRCWFYWHEKRREQRIWARRDRRWDDK